MKQRSPLFLVLLASLSLVGAHGSRADTESGDATMAVADAGATQSCVDNVCVGMYAKVTSGDFAGEEGAVVGIDDENGTATLAGANGEYAYPLLADLTSQNALNWDGCFANVCIGDKVKLLSGPYRKKKGRVVALNPENATAVVLVKRKVYVTISVADLKVKRREVYSTPYPERRYYRSYRTCGYDSIFDAYRGCVHLVRIYHPIPHRVLIVHRVPRPRPARPVILHRRKRPSHAPRPTPARDLPSAITIA